MNEDWARLRRLIGKPNGSDYLAAAGKYITLLASLASEGTGASMAIEGATNNVHSFEITWPISRVQLLRTPL